MKPMPAAPTRSVQATADRVAANVSESGARLAASRSLVQKSRRLVARSRRLGNAPPICGGSEAVADLRQSVRLRLSSGVLNRLNGDAWLARPGLGGTCAVCAQSIGNSDVGCVVDGPPTQCSHLACYAIWLDESKAVREGCLAPADLVELRTADASCGRVVAAVQGGGRIYVRWIERSGYTGRVTIERADNLRKHGVVAGDSRLDLVRTSLRTGALTTEAARLRSPRAS